MLRHFSRIGVFFFFFFQIFNVGNIFDNFDQKMQKKKKKKKKWFLPFWSTFSKILPIQKFEKLFTELCLNMMFKHFSIFYSKLFFYLVTKIIDQEIDFLPFCQKVSIFSKIWYQKWILWLISIPKMYTFIYIKVIVWESHHSICFKKMWGHTSLNVK